MRKKEEHLNHYEKAILQARPFQGMKQIDWLLSSCRQTRPTGLAINPHLQTIWETSAWVIGPAFFFYVWWVLDSARQQGISRLYFLARDGDILFKIAQVINRRWNFHIDCRYLPASRESWFFPAIDKIGPFETDWMTSYYPSFCVSINSIGERIGINPLELHHELASNNFPEHSWEKDLSAKELLRAKKFLQNPALLKKMQPRIDQDFSNTVAYLRQAGIFDPGTFALVDIGWKGSMQYALSKILKKAGHRPAQGLRGYYFGLNPNKKIYDNDLLVPFLINGKHNCLQNNTLYCEVFAASAERKTVTYRLEGETTWTPVLGPATDQLLAWGVETQQQSILRFTENMTAVSQPQDFSFSDIKPVLESILYSFLLNPTNAEAESYGKIPITVSLTEKDLVEFAPKFELRNWGLPRTYWVPGSCERSGLGLGKVAWRIFQHHPVLYEMLRQIFIALQKILGLNQSPSRCSPPRTFLADFYSKLKEILGDPQAILPHLAGLFRRLQVRKISRDGEIFYQYKGKAYPEYLNHGNASFYIRYLATQHCHGQGIDVGAGSWPIPGAIPVQNDQDQNAFNLPHFKDNSLDFVFSSHCLEHLRDWQTALRLWISKIRPGGIIFLYLPHKDMLMWRPGGPWVGGHHRWNPEAKTVNDFLQKEGITILDCDPNPDRYFSFHIVGKKNPR